MFSKVQGPQAKLASFPLEFHQLKEVLTCPGALTTRVPAREVGLYWGRKTFCILSGQMQSERPSLSPVQATLRVSSNSVGQRKDGTVDLNPLTSSSKPPASPS